MIVIGWNITNTYSKSNKNDAMYKTNLCLPASLSIYTCHIFTVKMRSLVKFKMKTQTITLFDSLGKDLKIAENMVSAGDMYSKIVRLCGLGG